VCGVVKQMPMPFPRKSSTGICFTTPHTGQTSRPFLSYFVIGIGGMADGRLMPAILRRRRVTLWAAPVVALGYLPFFVFTAAIDLEHAPGYTLVGLAYIAWRSALAWVMTLVFVGAAATYLTARPRFLGWASSMVLPFYVLHHPVTVVVAAMVVPLSLGLWAKYGLIVLVAGSVTVLLCAALDVATSTLNGRLRRSRPMSVAPPETAGTPT